MRHASRLQVSFPQKALIIIALAGTTFACQNQLSDPTPTSESATPVVSQRVQTDHYDAVAQTLAKAVADPAVRQLIYDAASKKAVGDYEVLYSQIANQPTRNGLTLAKAMKQVQPTNAAARTSPIDVITSQTPLLNIAVPVNLDKWNAATYTPLVVIQSQATNSQLKAYDKDGNVHWLDAKKAPDYPVIVVGQSERDTLSASGQAMLKKGLLSLPAPKPSYLLQDPGDNGGGGGGGGGVYCSDMNALNVTLSGWYSGNISAIESWDRGCPEIRMRAFGSTQSGTKVDVYGDPVRGNLWEPNSRSDVDGNWWGLNDYLFYWNVGQYGEEVTFVLHEEDGGSPKDISIPVNFKSGGFTASTTITFRVDDGDDYVGYFPRRIPFCNGSEIGNETLKFRVNRSY